ncbi:MAG: hypothetical protein IKS36_03340 [Bacteroidales bacterium]|nr:hypothetical protein [Bacteroidales bacterium]
MKKTKSIFMLSAVIMMSLWMVSCNHTQEQQADTMQPADTIVEETTPVSMWQTTVDEYLVENIGKRLGVEKLLVVPYYTVFDVDSSDDNDYRVLGDWWVAGYDSDKDMLITSLETCAPGLFHLQKTADGFIVKNFEEVQEGRAIEENAQRIFGKYCDAFWAAHDNQENKDSVRLAMMSEYVHRNNLPFTKLMLDSALPPVEL